MMNALSSSGIILSMLVIAACGDVETTVSPDNAEEQFAISTARTYAFDCQDDLSFVARVEAGSAWLFLPGQTYRLPSVVSASGAKFSDGVTTFWSKAAGDTGMEAMLEYDGRKYTACMNDAHAAVWEHAKLDGADFRATGNEPGWHLEIHDGDDIVLVSGYGQIRHEFEDMSISVSADERRTLYTTVSDEGPVEVILVAEVCRDTMADVQYDTRVTVRIGTTVLDGCGRALH